VYGDWPPVAVTLTVLVAALDEHVTTGAAFTVTVVAAEVLLHPPLATTTV